MMTGIVSDSHGNLENLKKAGRKMAEEHGVDLIIHLGDDSCEIDVLKELNVELLKVPGVYETCYKTGELPARLIRDIEGWKCFISHTEKSHENDPQGILKPEEVREKKLAQVFLFGHSHIPSVREEGGILFINPGHLKDEDKKGYPPTYAVAEIVPEKITVEIIELGSGKKIMEKLVNKL